MLCGRYGKRYPAMITCAAGQGRRMLFSAGTVIFSRRFHRCHSPVCRDILFKSRDGRLSLTAPGYPVSHSDQKRQLTSHPKERFVISVPLHGRASHGTYPFCTAFWRNHHPSELYSGNFGLLHIPYLKYFLIHPTGM